MVLPDPDRPPAHRRRAGDLILWRPDEDDGDALRLAVQLGLEISIVDDAGKMSQYYYRGLSIRDIKKIAGERDSILFGLRLERVCREAGIVKDGQPFNDDAEFRCTRKRLATLLALVAHAECGDALHRP